LQERLICQRVSVTGTDALSMTGTSGWGLQEDEKKMPETGSTFS